MSKAALFLCAVFLLAGLRSAERLNIGTVLFAPSDANKECWSADSLALLTSRMVLEGILPRRECLNVNDDQIINDIIEYFRLILEVIRKNTFGKTKHLMLMALTDTLGGYMKHFFLPVAKYAYYAGNVDYNSVIKIHQLFDELKNYLRTNGAGWSKPPANIGDSAQAQVITMQAAPPNTDPCKGLVFTRKGSRERKREAETGLISIPMPYFDSKTRPSAIAIPFKAYSLRNMESKSSAYILVKFYIASSRCLSAKSGNEASTQEFNTNLFSFIMKQVMPHLCDEKFYAAFGGVLRILETMKKFGYEKNGKIIGSIDIMPETEEKELAKEKMEKDDEEEEKQKEIMPALINPKPYGHESLDRGPKKKASKSNLIVLAALVTIIVWFFLGACFICCRIRSARIKRDEQTKLIEEGDTKGRSPRSSSRSSSKSKCYSSSSKSKCSTASGQTARCNRETCANFSSSNSSGRHISDESRTKEPASPKSASTKSSSSGKDSGSNSPKMSSTPIQVQTAQYYPASFACHSSMSGKYKAGSSTDDFTSKDTIKKPFVFGYDFQTTSEETTPRETSDGETDLGGNMSK